MLLSEMETDAHGSSVNYRFVADLAVGSSCQTTKLKSEAAFFMSNADTLCFVYKSGLREKYKKVSF